MRKQSKLSRKLSFSRKLLEWHKSNTVSFPWRKTHDPYRVLISEMFLRKTNREQVRPVFSKFIAKYPTIASLSEAKPDDIESLITPLGMEHERTQLLREIARIIMASGGNIPLNKNSLLQLPGVGNYVANAVLCFSSGRDVPLVDDDDDDDVQRVFSIRSHKARAREDKGIWKYVASLIPPGKARLFNMALLDFAAAVCTTRAPRCKVCPISTACDYYHRDISQTTRKSRNVSQDHFIHHHTT